MAFDPLPYIRARAGQLGLDPNAVLAIAHHEGLGGGVGDNGTSFGPWQLHQGGALPKNIPLNQAQQWAWSKQGIDYALGKMAQDGARGLTGQAAVSAISRNFERPANPGAEISDAMSVYGKVGGKSGPVKLPGGAGGAASQLPPTLGGSVLGNAQNQLATLMLQQSSQTVSGQAPDMGGLLGALLTRQQAQATQSVYGPGKQDVSLDGGVTIKGVSNASSHDIAAVNAVKSYVGTPYVWGGESPQGFDCSGLVQYVWGKQGVNIPRTTYDQWRAGQSVAQGALRPGDAVFFKGSDSKTVNGQVLPGHVGMYIGGGKFVESPHTGSDVQISTLAGRTDFMGARRYG